jgi:hypothetical protein
MDTTKELGAAGGLRTVGDTTIARTATASAPE